MLSLLMDNVDFDTRDSRYEPGTAVKLVVNAATNSLKNYCTVENDAIWCATNKRCRVKGQEVEKEVN